MQLRATKYNPINRDACGRYTKDEFISASDVGKVFDGVTLTAVAYVTVEDSYVQCVYQLLNAACVDSVSVVGLENWVCDAVVDPAIEKMRPARLDAICEGAVLRGDEIGIAVRMALREMIWCRLHGDHGLYVHFGYDFYMYIGFDQEAGEIGPAPKGMYYEPMASPYAGSGQ